MSNKFRVAIIGGGIGGVALARSLQKLGVDYHLFEKATEFGEVGAGVQMTPNAVKVLKEIGLKDDLYRIGFLPDAMVGRNWETSEELFRTPLEGSSQEVYGAEFFHVHRADLHSILSKDIPSNRITFGVKCMGVEQGDGVSFALFNDGSRFEADLIVGADGIHSVIRNSLWGEKKPKFTGHMCWRALVPVEEYPLSFVGPDSSFWMGPNSHVVTYYVKGGKAVNIVAVIETDEWIEESWTIPSSKEELLAAYSGWHSNITELFKLIDASQIFKWGLFDHDPMRQWSIDNATLLGDAAHPMLPFLSQGAAMAIEDGYVLAQAIVAFDRNVKVALSAYEKERCERTSNVQLQARERGKSFHLSTPEEIRARDLAYQAAQEENSNAVGIRAEWIYEYDATTCRDRFLNSI